MGLVVNGRTGFGVTSSIAAAPLSTSCRAQTQELPLAARRSAPTIRHPCSCGRGQPNIRANRGPRNAHPHNNSAQRSGKPKLRLAKQRRSARPKIDAKSSCRADWRNGGYWAIWISTGAPGLGRKPKHPPVTPALCRGPPCCGRDAPCPSCALANWWTPAQGRGDESGAFVVRQWDGSGCSYLSARPIISAAIPIVLAGCPHHCHVMSRRVPGLHRRHTSGNTSRSRAATSGAASAMRWARMPSRRTGTAG